MDEIILPGQVWTNIKNEVEYTVVGTGECMTDRGPECLMVAYRNGTGDLYFRELSNFREKFVLYKEDTALIDAFDDKYPADNEITPVPMVVGDPIRCWDKDEYNELSDRKFGGFHPENGRVLGLIHFTDTGASGAYFDHFIRVDQQLQIPAQYVMDLLADHTGLSVGQFIIKGE